MSKSSVEKLGKAVASWQKSVDHYRGQIKSDAMIIGLGGFLMGAGVIGFVADAPVAGAAAEALGIGFSAVGAKELTDDMKTLIEVTGTTAVRQYELDQAEDGQE